MKTPYPVFTEDMKSTHTILMPNMLPIHFKLIARIMNNYGYRAELLENEGKSVLDAGLESVHNDTCYPALLVIGQFIDAIESGKYDTDKLALLITQTGGGCRASNYIYLLRKALKQRGWGHIPVISFNFSGLDKEYSFRFTIPMMTQLLYSLMLGDLIMLLYNQCSPYELTTGDTVRAEAAALEYAYSLFARGKPLSGKRVRKAYIHILELFAAVERSGGEKIKVGIVGEIYVKYAPIANNHLEDFLRSMDAEVVVPGLVDFCMYCIANVIFDRELYGGRLLKASIFRIAYRVFLKKQRELAGIIKKHGVFAPPPLFGDTIEAAKDYISLGVKMGEGWLLTAEMVELIASGVENIVCAQPFGCLPNHIAGKGVMRRIKENNPRANIVAVDYDPGATRINQENRIKLMLSVAARNRQAQADEKQSGKTEPALV